MLTNKGSNSLVIWVLFALFAAVGFYLIWYTRRRKSMLQTFSKTHNLSRRPDLNETLLNILDRCFSLNQTNLIRSFAQISSIIDAGPIWIFCAVELLDLYPHAKSYSTHFPRIAALFEVSSRYDAFFLLDISGQISQKLSDSKLPNSKLVDITKQTASFCHARHPLSVTLTTGYGLIYFETLVTGGETLSDIECLYCISKKMNEKFAG